MVCIMDQTSPSLTAQVNSSALDSRWSVGATRNLGVVVRKALERYIRENDLQPGDRLPTESELCSLFDVSRTAVREAMKALEIMGIISIEPGRGTFVRSFDIGVMLSNLPTSLAFRDHDIEEIMEVRKYLERLCVEKAVKAARDFPGHPLWDELEKCTSRMKTCALEGTEMWDEDIRFHRTLALLADNQVLLMVLEVFWSLRKDLPTDNSKEALLARYQDHRRLLDAIIKGNAKESIALCEQHISNSTREVVKASR